MEDILSVSRKIQEKIKTLELGRSLLKERAEEKAYAVGEYEKQIAKTLIGLKNGKEYTLEGERIQNPPASTTEKIARGICFQEKINSELAETSYRNAVIGMQAIEAEINSWQSIFRYLEHTTEE